LFEAVSDFIGTNFEEKAEKDASVLLPIILPGYFSAVHDF
jgi:hypothetical protein